MNINKQAERMGKKNKNNQGYLMTIIEYHNANDIIVEFEDKYRTKINTRYVHFVKGDIKNPYHPDLYNVAMNGNKYPSRLNGNKTKEYRAWVNILIRCYDKKFKEKHKTYQDVICCKEWLLFDNFYEWLHEQENFEQWFNGRLWAVDKDILIKGNKLYCPQNCCLVPPQVNTLFTKRDSARSDFTIGVMQHRNKYRGHVSINGKQLNMPVRRTIEEAFADYKAIKEDNIRRIAQMEYKEGNITKKCYDAMMSYEVEITD